MGTTRPQHEGRPKMFLGWVLPSGSYLAWQLDTHNPKEHTMPNRRGGAVRGTYRFVLDQGTQSQTEGLFQGLRSFHSNSLLGYMTSSIVYVTYAHIKIIVRLTFSFDKHGRIEYISWSIALTWKGAHHQPWHKWPLALGRGSPASWRSVLQRTQWLLRILQHRTHEPQTSPWAGILCRWHCMAPSELRSCSPVKIRENTAGGREGGQHGWMSHRRAKRPGYWISHFLACAPNLTSHLGSRALSIFSSH